MIQTHGTVFCGHARHMFNEVVYVDLMFDLVLCYIVFSGVVTRGDGSL